MYSEIATAHDTRNAPGVDIEKWVRSLPPAKRTAEIASRQARLAAIPKLQDDKLAQERAAMEERSRLGQEAHTLMAEIAVLRMPDPGPDELALEAARDDARQALAFAQRERSRLGQALAAGSPYPDDSMSAASLAVNDPAFIAAEGVIEQLIGEVHRIDRALVAARSERETQSGIYGIVGVITPAQTGEVFSDEDRTAAVNALRDRMAAAGGPAARTGVRAALDAALANLTRK